jgi:hypothetical protein
MKTKISILPLAILFSLMTAMGCATKAETFTEYACPMNCENKTYDKPGTCPVCGMDLEGVKTKK